MIERFFTTSFSFKRQSWSNDSSSVVTTSTFLGSIPQPVQKNDYTKHLHLDFTKAYQFACPVATNILEGDFNDDYVVKYVIKAEIGNNQHLEIFVEKI